MYGYIYLTENLINGKIYVGQKKSNVFLGNKYLGSGKYLKRAINKYGYNNFNTTLIEKCDTKMELDIKEKYWISKLKSQDRDIGYNLNPGGSGGCKESYWKGKHLSEETKKKISDTCKRKKISPSDDAREKAVLKLKGTKRSVEYCEKLRQANLGKHLSEETKLKIKLSNKHFNKGRIAVHKDEKDIYIKKEDLNYYLALGYVKGGHKRKHRRVL